MSDTVYCLDTNSFIRAWVDWYPIDSFPALWERFDQLAENGKLISSVEVLRELSKKEDDLFKWAKQREKKLFVDIDESQQKLVSEIMGTHPRLVDTLKNRSGGDPWVIALARQRKSVVVSMEKNSLKLGVPKIPDVCKAYDVRCITLPAMIRELKLRFVLSE